MIDLIHSLLMIVEVILALLIICLVLLQRSKSGGGLGGITGGAGAEDVLGANAGNILSRATTIIAIIFFFTTVGLTVLQGQATRSKDSSVVDSVASEASDLPGNPSTEKLLDGGITAEPASPPVTEDVGADMASDQDGGAAPATGGELKAPAATDAAE